VIRRAHIIALGIVATLAAGATTAGAVPTVTYTCTPGSADCSGWSAAPVTLKWSTAGEDSSTGCNTVTFSLDGVASRACSATAGATTITVTATVRVDRTPPTGVAATPSRPPDRAGWYVQPLTVAFSGTDATSGVASCTTAGYSGPDGPVSVGGTCTDLAGNTSPAVAHAFSYDATPPDLSALDAEAGDRSVRLRWTASADVAAVEVLRTSSSGGVPAVVYRGTGSELTDASLENGVSYTYRAVAVDAAGNSATSSVAATPGRRLLPATVAARGPERTVLRWTPVSGARYYNVQVYRGRRKILSAWPGKATFRLPPTWRYGGRKRSLTAGTYRWYVWPGFGPPAARRFGRVIGPATFRIASGLTAKASYRRGRALATLIRPFEASR